MWIKKRRWPVFLWILGFLILAAATCPVVMMFYGYLELFSMPAFLADAIYFLSVNAYWLCGADIAYLLALAVVLITAPRRREKALQKELLHRFDRYGRKFDEEEADITY